MDGTPPYVCMYASKGPRDRNNADASDSPQTMKWSGKRALVDCEFTMPTKWPKTHYIPRVAQLVARACTTTIRNDANISKRQLEKALDCWRAQMRLLAPPRSDAAPVSTPPGLLPTMRVVDGGQGGAFG